ncbi:MAG TPA: cyclic pyranopterin monophosphate synthase MoaC [Candidatus Dormibacteraeota bacterium]|nr:cyclic pyranopterin monophosphate synthase MoaC [Candidatus Dormibacteraeota bacterium]
MDSNVHRPASTSATGEDFSHLTKAGGLVMVDVSAKSVSERSATAAATVVVSARTEALLRERALPKGDVLVAAQIAGILAAKRTAELIPLCHSLPLSSVDVAFSWSGPGRLEIRATAKTSAQTGVEMEALTAASVAALTVYDMVKAVEKGVVIERVRLLEKRGGKSGTWTAPRQ